MRVLIIDDSPSILECTRALLEKDGHAVVTCESFLGACVELGLLVPFNVVICDGFDGDGPRLLMMVRNTFSRVKTILHSADSALVEAEKTRGFCAIVKGDSWGALLGALGTPVEVPR